MNVTLQVKLQPTPEQKDKLLATMQAFNAACGFIATVAFSERSANRVKLQQIVYKNVREKFGLGAQMTVRAIAKVCEVYKRDKSILPKFRPLGAIVYDQRIMTWKGIDRVSLLTMAGREVMPFLAGSYHEARMGLLRGQADLVYRDGMFFLYCVADVDEPPAFEPDGFLGVDLGIKNIATTSDGETMAGGHLNGLRARHAKIRQRLQSTGTKSAKRLLKKRRLRESRHAANVNHVISKRLVAVAHDTGRGIAFENLEGIRSRITVRRAQRRKQHSWAFRQLRRFTEYKSRLRGVPFALVDPRWTSQACSCCGFVDRGNRKTRDDFLCLECGHAEAADHNAAKNIGRAARHAAIRGPEDAIASDGLASPVL